MLTMKFSRLALVVLFQTYCLAIEDSPFSLQNKHTGFCLSKRYDICMELRWTTAGRLLGDHNWIPKCLGVQGKNVGSEVSFYDCDETSELQQWECKNETLIALKGHELYIELKADNTAVLSKIIGPNNQLTISGMTSGACSRTYREMFTIDGTAAGRPCMFPFLYKDYWYDSCTREGHIDHRLWCSVETKYDHELWGNCPSKSKDDWHKHPITGAKYQLNTRSALTWSQADTSCKQQGASLLSITDPNQQAYVTALLSASGGIQEYKLWTGLILDTEHGWQWRNGKPFRYLKWDSGHPASDPGHMCGIINGAVEYSWQTSKCNKHLGYICYSDPPKALPTEAPEAGFCSSHWIPYNGHCFQLFRTKKTWTEAQKECRKEGGDLLGIRNVEDQSFVISQLGYASTDRLWIGLNDRSTEGLFDWSDHAPVTFTSWEYGYPSTTFKDDCVLMRGENGNWVDGVCTEKNGYICMKQSSSEPSGDEIEMNLGCKAGWKRHGSYCYFTGTETKTFDEAQNDCKSSDSYLADVSTGLDNAFLVSMVGLRPEKHFWLGLSNQEDIDYFVWTNKNSIKFTHWNAEMPGHQQGCVAMATGSFAGLWDVLPCTNKEKYICKHLAEGAPLTPVPPTKPAPKCADGWTGMPTRDVCLKAFTGSSNRKTWYEARDYCQAIGGDLLSLHSQFEQHLVPERYTYAWIGLSATDPINGFVWSDGSPVNYQHWRPGQPDNRNNAESCVEIIPYLWDWTGSWSDEQCEKLNGWLCQIRAGVTPKPPPDPVIPDFNKTSDGWLQWNGSQYYINEESMAMEKARAFCQQRHGDLATINSDAENVFLWQQMSAYYDNYWIGLTVDFDRTYEWMDGSQVLFQKWDEGQPNFAHFDENCVVMKGRSGFWHDYNCGFEQRSICKRTESTPANTTATPPVPQKGGCPKNWKKINSKCYSIVHQNLTWQGARQTCKDMGGNLASISSRYVQVNLISQIADSPTSDLWIGFHNLHGRFLWTDGQPVSYSNLALTGYQGQFVDNWFWYRHYFLRRSFYEQKTNCAVINTNPSHGIGKWIPRSCNDTNAFICLRKVDPLLPDSPEPTNSPTYVTIRNDSLKFVSQPMNWEEANRNCDRDGDGAKLASLPNEWTQLYVELLALRHKAPLWIGLNKKQTDGYFRFIQGWHLAFTRWGETEPSRDKHCVYVDVDGKWKTAHCNETFSSVCMKTTDVPPTESAEFPGICPEDPYSSGSGQNLFSMPFRGHCYIFFTEVKEWPEAATSCAKHGGELASIENPSEQEFIHRNVKIYKDSYTSFWTGLYKNHRGEMLWLDKAVMDYTNWGTGEPDEGNHGEINTMDGTWKVTTHDYKPYICKILKVNPPNPPPSPRVQIRQHLRSHMVLAAVIIFAALLLGLVISFFVFKKSGHRLPIPEKLNTFENPLFFSTKEPKSDLSDTSQLVENAAEIHTELITI